MRTPRAMLVAVAMLTAAGAAHAQGTAPEKPIRVITSAQPGSGLDTAARVLAEAMQDILARPLAIDGRPGGFGMIGGQEVMRSPADGDTVLIGDVGTHAVWPAMVERIYPFDHAGSIVAVTAFAEQPALVVASTRLAPATLVELLEQARAEPGAVRYASTGVGSFSHIAMALLARRAGVEMEHVPNRENAAGMIKDVVSAELDAAVMDAAAAAPLIRDGALRPLAAVAARRLDDHPDVPTLAELGFADAGVHRWLGLFVRAGTPDAAIAALHKAALDAVGRPATLEKLGALGMRPFVHETPQAAADWIATERARWRRLIGELGLGLD